MFSAKFVHLHVVSYLYSSVVSIFVTPLKSTGSLLNAASSVCFTQKTEALCKIPGERLNPHSCVSDLSNFTAVVKLSWLSFFTPLPSVECDGVSCVFSV